MKLKSLFILSIISLLADDIWADNTSLLVNSINWTSFEVRNPKDLYLMDGSLYDGDAPLELMDETSAYYNLPTDTEKVRNRKVRTAQVKKYIKNLSTYYTEIQAMNKAKRSADAIRQRLAEQIDVDGPPSSPIEPISPTTTTTCSVPPTSSASRRAAMPMASICSTPSLRSSSRQDSPTPRA